MLRHRSFTAGPLAPILFLALAVLLVTVLNCPAALADNWSKVNSNGFGSTHNTWASAMAVYSSKLYVGTENAGGCQVWRNDSGTNWTKVGTGGFGNANNAYVSAMAVYNSKLYAATDNATNGGQIYRYDGVNDWARVCTDGLGNTNNRRASSLVVFNSGLYAGTFNSTDGAEVRIYGGGTAWTQKNTDGFGDSDNWEAASLAVYDSHLYAGVLNQVFDGDEGARVFRYGSGTSWTAANTNGFGDANNLCASSMVVYNSRLYAATRSRAAGIGFQVHRYSGSGTSWTKVGNNGIKSADNENGAAMVSLGDYLYVGTVNGSAGSQVLRYSGSTWSKVNSDGFEDSHNDGIYAMAVMNADFYAGTSNIVSGGEVWKHTGIAVPTPSLGGPASSRDGKATLYGSIEDSPGATIKIYDGSTFIAETTVNSYGNYTVDVAGLSHGNHSLYAIAFVTGVPSARSATLSLKVDLYTPSLERASMKIGDDAYGQDDKGVINANVAGVDQISMSFNLQTNADVVLPGDSGGPLGTGVPKVLPYEEKLILDYDNSTQYAVGAVQRRRTHDGWYAAVEWGSDLFRNISALPAAQYWYKRGGWVEVKAFYEIKYSIYEDERQLKFEEQWEIYHAWVNAKNIHTQLNTPPRDPSGIIYDNATGRRVSGATVTCENQQGSAGPFTKWPALEYNQPNPQYTNNVGWYGWFVPGGDYRVTAEKDGYNKATSREVTVPPEVTDLHVGMDSKGPRTYYFAEGTTRPGFEEWICLQNPGDTDAHVTITYMLGTGQNRDQSVVIPKKSRFTVDVNNFLGPDQDVSAKVTSDRLVIAERPIYFNYRDKWPGGHDVVGAEEPSPTWYFAEGCTRPGFEEWLCIQNPGDTDADVTITYMLGTGKTKTTEHKVAARSRSTVDVNLEVGAGQDVSAKVEAADSKPIICERPLYFDYRDAWAGGHDVLGAQAARAWWYFAEGCTRPGFEEWLCIQNPGSEAADITITYMLGTGKTKTTRHEIAANSRMTVEVNSDAEVGAGQDVSCIVQANAPIIAERPLYFNYRDKWAGGHDVVGAMYTKNIYFLAEGCTRPGFEEWLCIQNPGDTDAAVTIDYMLGNGQNKTQKVTVKKQSRYTVDVGAFVGLGQDVSAKITTADNAQIIVERPMYFNYRDKWAGGHDVVGF